MTAIAGAISGDTNVSLTSLSGGIASAAAANDIVIAIYGAGSQADDLSLSITDGSTAYTLLGSELYSDDTRDTNLRVAYKIMGGTPDTTTTFGPTGNVSWAGLLAVYVWRGVDTTTPIDVTVQTATGIDTLLVNPPSITPTTAGAVIVCAGAGARGSTTSADTYSSSDLSNFYSLHSSDDTGVVVGVGSKDWISGAFDAAQWTFDGIDNSFFSWGAVALVLRPSAAGSRKRSPTGGVAYGGMAY